MVRYDRSPPSPGQVLISSLYSIKHAAETPTIGLWPTYAGKLERSQPVAALNAVPRPVAPKRPTFLSAIISFIYINKIICNKKAQLSLTNSRDAKACQKIAPIRRAYNVVADNTGLSSFV